MMNTKKILVIAGGTYVSGAEKVTIDVLKGLKEKGYDLLCMVSGWNDGDFIDSLKQTGIQYKAIKLGWYYISKLLWSLDSLVHYPKAIIDFIRLRRSFKADLVYIISYRQIVLLYPFFNKNIVYHVHDCYSNSRQSRFFLKLIDRKVKKYIAVSHFIKNDLIKCGIDSEKIHTIHNGIAILPVEERILNKVFTIGIVGQIIPRKGHTVVLDAMVLLQKKNIDVKLVIVGKEFESYKASVESRITQLKLDKWVEWRGYKKDQREIYKGIDVVVAPTQTEEPFGLMACEANMLDKPAIVSNTGGLPEIIKDGVNGFTINANDPVMLAERIEMIYLNPELYKAMSERGRAIVKNEFSIEKMNLEMDNLLQQIKTA